VVKPHYIDATDQNMLSNNLLLYSGPRNIRQLFLSGITESVSKCRSEQVSVNIRANRSAVSQNKKATYFNHVKRPKDP
jgi:hypothetical protein